MAEIKTKVNDDSVASFLDGLPDARVRDDCRAIAGMMQAATKAKPEMWGAGIVGFGRHVSVNSSGKKAEWMLIGFAPRKQNIVLYIMEGLDKHDDLLADLGKHSCGKGCLYVNRLSDIHVPTLKKLVRASVVRRRKTSVDSL